MGRNHGKGVHVSPGVYTKEIDLNVATRSLGITTLGLVGETLKGPAFAPMAVSNWREFVELFGGTSPAKFKGSKYPKYEAPYVAKTYLTQSKQLEFCRVLGLSGYNAGPAWCVTTKVLDRATAEEKEMIVAVIRSRGHYEKYYKFNAEIGTCECKYQAYDTLLYNVGEKEVTECNKVKSYNLNALQIGLYTPLESSGNECVGYGANGGATSFDITSTNYGRFKLFGWSGLHTEEELAAYIVKDAEGNTSASDEGRLRGDYFEFPVSLNPMDSDYILKVLGTQQENGEAPIYVESLYDVALSQQINADNAHAITNALTSYQVYFTADYNGLEPVHGFMTIQEEGLKRKDVGKRFLATQFNVDQNYHCHLFDLKTNKPVFQGITKKYTYDENGKATQVGTWSKGIDTVSNASQIVVPGQIYTVAQYTDEGGKRHYYYRYYDYDYTTSTSDDGYLTYLEEHKDVNIIPYIDKLFAQNTTKQANNRDTVDGLGETVKKAILVKNLEDNLYYRLAEDPMTKKQDVFVVKLDLNNYKSAYRFASTPWIVSNVKGDYRKIELNKLFRFHTISDGDTANNMIKVSIENVRFDEGTFDVVVRDINDTDESIVPLEKFGKCTLTPGDSNYIGLKIGTYNGDYETRSKYITVEVNERDTTELSSPCGFLGYPIHDYSGLQIGDLAKTNVISPILNYNRMYDVDIKNRKQYFGLSNIVGVDVDAFTFKGNASYVNGPEYISQGFHLDSRLDFSGYSDGERPELTVDGEYGYEFDAVSINNRTSTLTEMPIIGKEIDMYGSIYENVNLRKFTVYFYGGFDGWDVYRDQRSNTDDFRKSAYKGEYNDVSGEGYAFDKILEPDNIDLNQVGITSDWYAYLSAIRKFANPESVDINIFATCGIDYVNQKTLVEETIEMIEEERADSIYVVTTPDKPSGAEDYVTEMYTAEDAVSNLEETDIDSNYTCTYYPWVKYFDQDNNQYINLPVTKDVVRNMAYTDNVAYSWFAPAGLSRGDVDCVKAHIVTKIGEEDTLYEGRINPVKTFRNEGVHIWGQKNLQRAETQMNRIAARRLLLRVRKLISIACNRLIFEPNDAQTKNKFLSLVTPILDNIKSNRGLVDYRVEVNDSVEARERRELPAKIFLKILGALEYITLDFIITPESVSFDDM